MAVASQESMEARAEEFRTRYGQLKAEIGKVIVGHDEIVDGVLTCLFVGGHALLEGRAGPGQDAAGPDAGRRRWTSKFNRIQFTPDLMPADIIGTNIVMEAPDGRRVFEFQRGPIFAQIVLADEINRATPKTQSALLEAMQEHPVTVGGTDSTGSKSPSSSWPRRTRSSRRAPIRCPRRSSTASSSSCSSATRRARSWRRSWTAPPAASTPGPEKVLDGQTSDSLQDLVREVIIAPHVQDYAIRLALATHPKGPFAAEVTNQYIRWGSSPRGVQTLVLAAKVRALLDGRYNVTLRRHAPGLSPGLRHRVLLNFEAQAEGIDPDALLLKVLESVPEKAAERTAAVA